MLQAVTPLAATAGVETVRGPFQDRTNDISPPSFPQSASTHTATHTQRSMATVSTRPKPPPIEQDSPGSTFPAKTRKSTDSVSLETQLTKIKQQVPRLKEERDHARGEASRAASARDDLASQQVRWKATVSRLESSVQAGARRLEAQTGQLDVLMAENAQLVQQRDSDAKAAAMQQEAAVAEATREAQEHAAAALHSAESDAKIAREQAEEAKREARDEAARAHTVLEAERAASAAAAEREAAKVATEAAEKLSTAEADANARIQSAADEARGREEALSAQIRSLEAELLEARNATELAVQTARREAAESSQLEIAQLSRHAKWAAQAALEATGRIRELDAASAAQDRSTKAAQQKMQRDREAAASAQNVLACRLQEVEATLHQREGSAAAALQAVKDEAAATEQRLVAQVAEAHAAAAVAEQRADAADGRAEEAVKQARDFDCQRSATEEIAAAFQVEAAQAREEAQHSAAATKLMEAQRSQVAANCRGAEAELDGVQSLNETLFKYLCYVAGRLSAAGESLVAAAPEMAHLRVELSAWCAQETAARRSVAAANLSTSLTTQMKQHSGNGATPLTLAAASRTSSSCAPSSHTRTPARVFRRSSIAASATAPSASTASRYMSNAHSREQGQSYVTFRER